MSTPSPKKTASFVVENFSMARVTFLMSSSRLLKKIMGIVNVFVDFFASVNNKQFFIFSFFHFFIFCIFFHFSILSFCHFFHFFILHFFISFPFFQFFHFLNFIVFFDIFLIFLKKNFPFSFFFFFSSKTFSCNNEFFL